MGNKILIVPNAGLTFSDGDLTTEKSTGEFAQELTGLGNNVVIYGQILNDNNKIHVYKLLKNGFKVKGVFRKKNKILNYVLLYLRIIPAIYKSDFVYFFYPTAFKYATIICWIFGKNYGLYVRGMNDLKGRLPNFIFRNSSAILSVSDYFTNYIGSVSSQKSIRTIRPMIDFKIEDIILDRKYISPKRFRLLYLGRMTSDKGVIELLHALKKLKVIGYKFDLKLVGEGEYMKELIDLVSELELKENVSFEGAVFKPETIKQYFINSDCYILGSYHEGFPRTLYEAMIFGTPILTTFVGGISALMQDRINCIEITPKSIESMYEALKLMMDDYTMLEPLAKNATETVFKILKERTLSHAADLNNLIK